MYDNSYYHILRPMKRGKGISFLTIFGEGGTKGK